MKTQVSPDHGIAALEIRERRIVAAFCSKKPSPEEIRWYEKQLKLFESPDPAISFQAMDNLIEGYKKGKTV